MVDQVRSSWCSSWYNGSEYRFVSKDPAQIEDLQCPVCFELAYEPVLTNCGHFFCCGCVRGQRSCPTCHSKLRYMRNQRDERKVKRLRVECPNWEKGCRWQGDLGDTAWHTRASCQMETVPCPRSCNQRVLRGLLGQHATTCARKPYTCPHCGFEDAHTDITSVHFTACGEFPAGYCKTSHTVRWLNTSLSVQKNLFHARMRQLGAQKWWKGKICRLTCRTRRTTTGRGQWTWWCNLVWYSQRFQLQWVQWQLEEPNVASAIFLHHSIPGSRTRPLATPAHHGLSRWRDFRRKRRRMKNGSVILCTLTAVRFGSMPNATATRWWICLTGHLLRVAAYGRRRYIGPTELEIGVMLSRNA